MARPRKRAPRRSYATGSVAALADGRFRARLPARLDPSRPAREFRTRAEAEAWLTSALAPPEAPSAGLAGVTLGDWCGIWWERYVQPVRAPTTAAFYRHALGKLASLHGVPLDALRASDLQGTIANLSAKLADGHLRTVVGVWRRCLAAALDDELVRRNPAARLVVPRPPPRTPKRHLSVDEARLLAGAIGGHRFEAAYALMLGCGLRIGEILGLRWIDVGERTLRVEQQFTNGRLRPAPKGRNPHDIPLPPFVAAALGRQRAANADSPDLVFGSPYARGGAYTRPWSPQAIGRDLAEIVGALKLPHATVHAGRRGLATHWLAAGVPGATVAELLGHASEAIARQFYEQATPEGLARAGAVVEALIGPDPGRPDYETAELVGELVGPTDPPIESDGPC